MSEESGDQGGELDTSTQDSGSAVATSPAESSQESPSGTSSGSPPQGDAVWGSFRQLPEFQGQDDRSIASYLYQAMQRERVAQQKLAQYQQYIPYAQEYLAHRPEFEKWKSSQTGSQAQQADQLQAAQPQVEKAWWNPPEIKDSYKKYLTKDENGRDVIAENAPLDARSALEDWMQYRADFARKFLENPQETLGPMVEKLAQQQAEKIVQDRFDTERKQAFVTNVEQENRDWLFDQETGQVSPEGMLVHKYIDEARSQGIQGPEARWKYAVAMTERDMLAMAFDQQQAMQAQQAQYAAQPAYQPPAMQAPQAPAEPPPQPKPDLAQQNMEYLRREAARNPSRSAGTQLTDPRAPKPKRTFEQFFKDQAMQDGLL